MTELAQRYTPGEERMYAVNSGASHLHPWFLQGVEGDPATLVTSALFPLLDCADAVAANVMTYIGEDPSAMHNKTHLRRMALLRQSRGEGSGHVADWAEYAAKRMREGR
ncbi:hypothetical protein ASE25_11305 [Terrabacter sp. Root85]|nr:hypothetical protein ASE25_11305 [Terrabacter sp. Root85]